MTNVAHFTLLLRIAFTLVCLLYQKKMLQVHDAPTFTYIRLCSLAFTAIMSGAIPIVQGQQLEDVVILHKYELKLYYVFFNLIYFSQWNTIKH